MKKPVIIGVMGGAAVSAKDKDAAYRLGNLIAKQGWILLNGGRNTGIMEASAKGAYEQGGITIGILPDDHHQGVSDYIQIPILTGMGNARNCINVLSSRIVVACPGGAGTLSEIALALKSNKTVILLSFDVGDAFQAYLDQGFLYHLETPEKVIDKIKTVIKADQPQ